MRSKSAYILLVAVFVLGSVMTGYAKEEWPETIVLAGYPEASDSYPYNVALARIMTRFTPTKYVVKGYAGSNPILNALGTGAAQLGAMNSYDAGQARRGKSKGFETKPLDVVLLAYLWPGNQSIGVRPNEGIDRMEDLKGKTVMLTCPFIPNFAFNKYMLEYYGVADSIKFVPITGIGGMKDAMINKTVAAFTWGVGASWTLEIQKAVGLKWLPYSHEAMKYAQDRVYLPIDVPMLPHNLKLYGLPPDTKLNTYAYPYSLMAMSKMPDHEVKGILKVIFEHGDMLSDAFYRGHQTTLKSATEIQAHFIPFHSAATEFYKQAGVWSPQNEARQKELLTSK